jgi:hypothetical protein
MFRNYWETNQLWMSCLCSSVPKACLNVPFLNLFVPGWSGRTLGSDTFPICFHIMLKYAFCAHPARAAVSFRPGACRAISVLVTSDVQTSVDDDDAHCQLQAHFYGILVSR